MWMGEGGRRNIRNGFRDSFYISFQFLPMFFWFRPLRGEGVRTLTAGPKIVKKKLKSVLNGPIQSSYPGLYFSDFEILLDDIYVYDHRYFNSSTCFKGHEASSFM